mgnify:CR=1 FL=1
MGRRHCGMTPTKSQVGRASKRSPPTRESRSGSPLSAGIPITGALRAKCRSAAWPRYEHLNIARWDPQAPALTLRHQSDAQPSLHRRRTRHRRGANAAVVRPEAARRPQIRSTTNLRCGVSDQDLRSKFLHRRASATCSRLIAAMSNASWTFSLEAGRDIRVRPTLKKTCAPKTLTFTGVV